MPWQTTARGSSWSRGQLQYFGSPRVARAYDKIECRPILSQWSCKMRCELERTNVGQRNTAQQKTAEQQHGTVDKNASVFIVTAKTRLKMLKPQPSTVQILNTSKCIFPRFDSFLGNNYKCSVQGHSALRDSTGSHWLVVIRGKTT